MNREEVTWLRERDIDLLVASELYGSPALANALFQKFQMGSAQFSGAFVSVTDMFGEADLIIVGKQADGNKMALLVENKIAASFQDEQDLRYRKRALMLLDSGQYSVVQTLLLAPSTYIENSSTDFDSNMSYEDVCNILDENDPRSAFVIRALRNGVEAQKRGYQVTRDNAVSEFWRDYYDLVCSQYSELGMKRPKQDKPAGSDFCYFQGVRRKIAGRFVDLVHKWRDGYVDLQFSSTTVDELHAIIGGEMPPDAVIAKANKSASLRFSVPTLSTDRPLGEQEEAAITGLDRCRWVNDWSRDFAAKTQKPT